MHGLLIAGALYVEVSAEASPSHLADQFYL